MELLSHRDHLKGRGAIYLSPTRCASEISGEVAAGWNVFGGYTYRESYATTQINYTWPYYKAVQDPFAVVGLLANYQVDEHLSVGLNVNNLFEKKYYDGMGTFNSGSYGEPRNAMVNAKWKF
ncbi:hypothetical protein V6L78_23730 [Pseudomonas canadensis]|uniref:hypothetical protein n=1 Tax=Pseudomonas canadensis TaxID=915099 RepID=UPI0030D4FAF7